MGKKKNKAKADATEQPTELSKKERKALKAREAQIEAELAAKAAEKKAAKKAKKKGKGDEHVAALVETQDDALRGKPYRTLDQIKADKKKGKAKSVDPGTVPTSEQIVADIAAELDAEAIVAAADKVLADKGASPGALASATKAKARALEGMTDEELKARVQAKRETREALLATADDIDRDDAEAVKAYNQALADLGGGRYLTSNAEREKEALRLTEPAKIQDPEASDNVERSELDEAHANMTASDEMPPTDSEVKAAKKAKRAAKPDELVVEIETEHGREFLAGAASSIDEQTGEVGEEFGKPSEAPKTDFETNGNGQYKVKRPSDGKLVGYTRVTSYINNLESTAQLEAWKMRVLLEGVASHDVSDDEDTMPEPIVVKVRELAHVRDMAITKARRKDRKGKLAVGELASLVDDAWKSYKRAIDALAQFALDFGGVKDAATKGTDIHGLTELYDREGIDAVGDLLTEGKITPADLADVEAYARGIEAAGVKIDRDNIERVVVNDDLKVAGRLDRTALVRLPGAARAVRVVADIKTGRIDYSAGKIAQQLEMYASAKGYDLNTHERTDLKLSRTKAVLIHLPAGSGECHVYVVDLGIGRIGNKLSGEVREWRNTGKKAIDTTVDLAKLEAVTP